MRKFVLTAVAGVAVATGAGILMVAHSISAAMTKAFDDIDLADDAD